MFFACRSIIAVPLLRYDDDAGTFGRIPPPVCVLGLPSAFGVGGLLGGFSAELAHQH